MTEMRETIDELTEVLNRTLKVGGEGLNAIIERAPERDIKWAGMNAHDIARAALSPKSDRGQFRLQSAG
jgi:hypothetical protein